MYETIKKFLAEGGRCLFIEDGKPVGVVLTIEEYNKLQHLPEPENPAPAQALFGPEQAENLGAGLTDADLNNNGDATLEDLGLDELPY